MTREPEMVPIPQENLLMERVLIFKSLLTQIVGLGLFSLTVLLLIWLGEYALRGLDLGNWIAERWFLIPGAVLVVVVSVFNSHRTERALRQSLRNVSSSNIPVETGDGIAFHSTGGLYLGGKLAGAATTSVSNTGIVVSQNGEALAYIPRESVQYYEVERRRGASKVRIGVGQESRVDFELAVPWDSAEKPGHYLA